MPESYIGREQTYLKHRVLKEYLQAWAMKLGSWAERLVFVDCFAGPWRSAGQARTDTSMAIGLGALQAAAERWTSLSLAAIFVEKDPASFAAMEAFVRETRGRVDVHALSGTFGDNVDRIDRLIGTDPAFVFVDPTGWTGLAMDFVARIARGRQRDVLINVMYDYIQRFKEAEHDFIRGQMRDLFGLRDEDLPPGLSEEELMTLYRDRLRAAAGLRFVADLAIPVPEKDRTYFRLVVGGNHPEVVRLFRDTERKVVGIEAPIVRTQAKERARGARSSQMALLAPPAPPVDAAYAEQRARAARDIRDLLPKRLAAEGPTTFRDLWPILLCDFHIAETELKSVLRTMQSDGLVQIDGMTPRERSVKDHHVIRIPAGPSR